MKIMTGSWNTIPIAIDVQNTKDINFEILIKGIIVFVENCSKNFKPIGRTRNIEKKI